MNNIDIFNEIASDYANKFPDLKEFKEDKESLDLFLRKLSKKRKILDMGCGTGIFSSYLKNKGFLVEGIDLSEKMLKIARKIKGIKFRKEDIKNTSYQNSSFDGVILTYVLNYVKKENINSIFKEAYRILKNDGLIYITISEGEDKEIQLPSPLNQKYKFNFNLISKKTLEDLFSKYNFKILYNKEKQPKNFEYNYNKLTFIGKKISFQ